MKLAATAALILGAMLLPSPAHARCDVSIDSPAQVRFEGEDNAGYDSYSRSRYSTEFSLSIRNRDADTTCSALLSVQRLPGVSGLQSSISATPLRYELSPGGSLANAIDVESDVGRPPNALTISVPPGGAYTQRLAFHVPPRQSVRSGDYAETLLLRVLQEDDLSIVAERNLSLQATVRRQASILLYDAPAAAAASTGAEGAGNRSLRMDFQTLETGEEASLVMLVQSNDPYDIDVTSQNGGSMRLLGAVPSSAAPTDTIDYRLFVSGTELDLRTGLASLGIAPPTGITGATNVMRVVIGDVSRKRAGRYEDQLTIAVRPD